MLVPQHLRNLLVDPRSHPRGLPHLSAASGLVRVHHRLYVVADEELYLGVFDEIESPRANSLPSPVGELVRLFDGELPGDQGLRKLAKPDLETLAALPPFTGCPFGALLALGSGSRSTRETGVLIALDAAGCLSGRMSHIDLSAVYAPIREQFPDLNIEGAFVCCGELRLLQRGNQGDARNACISFDWNQVVPWLVAEGAPVPAAKRVQIVPLGNINGVVLSFTDGAALDHGAWAFCAVAENTADSFQDGACVGSAVGVVAPDGQVTQMQRLWGAPKVEGLATQAKGRELSLTMVTDADNPDIAAQLLCVSM